MKRVFFVLATFLVFSACSFAQPAIGKEINDRDIQWSDFTSPVDPASRFDAWTDWRITYTFGPPSVRDSKAYVRVSTRLFLSNASWVKPDKKTQRLLEHEQGHYRIGRLCAREIESTINSTAFSIHNYPREINEVYWAVIRKYQEINKQYDRETNHYHDREGQARWNKLLDDLLKK